MDHPTYKNDTIDHLFNKDKAFEQKAQEIAIESYRGVQQSSPDQKFQNWVCPMTTKIPYRRALEACALTPGVSCTPLGLNVSFNRWSLDPSEPQRGPVGPTSNQAILSEPRAYVQ